MRFLLCAFLGSLQCDCDVSWFLWREGLLIHLQRFLGNFIVIVNRHICIHICTKDTAGQSANGLRGLPRVTYIDHDSDFERVLRPPARAGSDYKMKVKVTQMDIGSLSFCFEIILHLLIPIPGLFIGRISFIDLWRHEKTNTQPPSVDVSSHSKKTLYINAGQASTEV